MLPLSKLVRLNDPLFLPFVMAGIPVSIFRHFTKDIDQLELTDPTKPLVVANVTLFKGLTSYDGSLGALLSRPDEVDGDPFTRRIYASIWCSSVVRLMDDVADSAWLVVSPYDNSQAPPTSKRQLRRYVDSAWGDIWGKHSNKIMDAFSGFTVEPPW